MANDNDPRGKPIQLPTCSNCPASRKLRTSAQQALQRGMPSRVCCFNPPQVTHLITPSRVQGVAFEMQVMANFPPVDDNEVCFQHPIMRAQYLAETAALAQEVVAMSHQVEGPK